MFSWHVSQLTLSWSQYHIAYQLTFFFSLDLKTIQILLFCRRDTWNRGQTEQAQGRKSTCSGPPRPPCWPAHCFVPSEPGPHRTFLSFFSTVAALCLVLYRQSPFPCWPFICLPVQLKHSFQEEQPDTFENLPVLVLVVIWADMLPMNQLVFLSVPSLFPSYIQKILSLVGFWH